MQVGDTMRGVITHVEEYGAFVDLVDIPGVSGLVHKSEISWAKLLSVEAAVQKGRLGVS
jgi:ribosomal protein S1